MNTSVEYDVAFCNLAKMMEPLQKTCGNCLDNMEKIMGAWNSIYQSINGNAIKTYYDMSKLVSMPGYLSTFLPISKEDAVLEDNVIFDSPLTEIVKATASYNTGAIDVNKINQEDFNLFRLRTDEVADAISHEDFEDGMENEITELVRSFVKRNKSAAYNWLNELYSKNFDNPSLVEGLLRVLAMVTEKGDECILLPIVISGLRSRNSAEQEAAIMVIEEWRTKDCLDALKAAQFGMGWVGEYASKVIDELEEEVNNGIARTAIS